MTKTKEIIYSLIMFTTFIAELVFLIVALQESNYILLVGTGVFYLIQAILGGVMFYEAVFKHNSESHWVTMATFNLIPFGQIVSSYFLYRVGKGK